MSFEGRILNERYLLESLISKGGMGEVYKGKHTLLGREVAVKILNIEWSDREDVVTRFLREAQAAASIAHQNVVEVLDVGFLDEVQPYIIMAYLEGESLAEMLKREGTLDLAAACGVLEPTLLALGAAHAKGIIHRDLKPENIFMTRDPIDSAITAKIIDFGIAKFINMPADNRLTIAGAAIGTPAYMSPEQARGDMAVDHRADLYSMGVLLYEMLVGKLPFMAATIKETLTRIIEYPPTSPRDENPDFPMAAEPIIEKAMSKSLADRYSSAAAFLDDVRKLDAYADRKARLECYASRIPKTRVSGEDSIRKDRALGISSSPASLSRVTSDPLYENAKISTIVVWDKHRPTKGRRMAVLLSAIVGLGAGLAIAGLIAVAFYSPSSSDAAQRLAPSGNKIARSDAVLLAEDAHLVTITVSGVPKTAGIFYDGAKMASNPFQVTRRLDKVPIRVEAPSHVEFASHVVPATDQTIEVNLTEVLQNPACADGMATPGAAVSSATRP